MPTVMKMVKKISKQQENESRRLASQLTLFSLQLSCLLNVFVVFFFLLLYRLWKDVTISLKEDDVEKATASKHKVLLLVSCRQWWEAQYPNG